MTEKPSLYNSKTAALYASLGVAGTSYQPAFDTVFTQIGSLKGQNVLDFGCGAGRSTRLLSLLEPDNLVGIDHNEAMIAQAQQNSGSGLQFISTPKDSQQLPFASQTFDKIFAFSVYCEFSDHEEMLRVTHELCRVLKPAGSLYVITTNPDCLGADFISFNYDAQPDVKNGDPIVCHVHTTPPFDIADTWWSMAAFDEVFTTCNFKIGERLFPLAKGEGWLDELNTAPSIIYQLTAD